MATFEQANLSQLEQNSKSNTDKSNTTCIPISKICSHSEKMSRLYKNLKLNNLISTYNAPSWVRPDISDKFIPEEKLNLSLTNTPIQKWDLSAAKKAGFNLFIKREDLNDNVLGGNKIKKLEFSIAKAIRNGHDHILTTGSVLSNHCRTTAICCSKLGLKCTLLQTSDQEPKDILTKGNILLSLMTAAKCVLLPGDTSKEDVNLFLKRAEEKIGQETEEGIKPYMILRGGTQADGIFSYIEIFDEIIRQTESAEENQITDIVVTSGSGGTAISLALASKLSGKNIKIHAVRIWGNNENGVEIYKKELSEIGLDYNNPKFNVHDTINYYDQYVGQGYGISNQKIDNLVLNSMRDTGIPLCTTYTGKTAAGMVDLMENRPDVFKGKNVLFLHTGGIPGLWGDENLHRAVGGAIEDGRILRVDDYL